MNDVKKSPKIRFDGFTDAWEQRKLGDKMYIKSRIGWQALTKKEYLETGNYYLITGTDIDEDNHVVDLKRCYYVSKERYEMDDKIQVHEGDIIVTKDGTIGKVAMVTGLDKPATLNSHLFVLRDISGTLYNRFLLQILSSHIFDSFVESTKTGSTLTGLPQKTIVEFKFLAPKFEEQKKISQFLDNLDSLITLHQRKCEKLKCIKKSMLGKMFPKNGEKFPEIRFKGFTDAWEQRKFASVFDGLQNNTLSRADLNYESGTVKNVHYGDVLIKFGDYIDAAETELPYISDDTKADKFKNSFLQDGDIVIADTAEDDTVGKCTEIQGSEGLKLLSGLHTIACRPKEKYGPMFLGYYINSPAYHNQLKPLMQGIKVTSISKSALQDTDMIMPKSIDEQIKIGEYFSNLDNLITLHQRKCDETKELKKYMLQNMFPQN
jgi:type I restriction enzyme S subunit